MPKSLLAFSKLPERTSPVFPAGQRAQLLQTSLVLNDDELQ